MNILHLKYVISIAENGSINRAAEELHVAQPNLSRVVKEMETDLGIQFFHRSSKGMTLTPDGELFVSQARKILEQIDEMESLYKEKKAGKQRFSISVPRASYIADAFAAFSGTLGKERNAYAVRAEMDADRGGQPVGEGQRKGTGAAALLGRRGGIPLSMFTSALSAGHPGKWWSGQSASSRSTGSGFPHGREFRT